MENDLKLAELMESAIAEMTASPQSFKGVIESLQHDKPYLIESLLLQVWREFNRPTAYSEFLNNNARHLLAVAIDGKLNSIASTTAASQLL